MSDRLEFNSISKCFKITGSSFSFMTWTTSRGSSTGDDNDNDDDNDDADDNDDDGDDDVDDD